MQSKKLLFAALLLSATGSYAQTNYKPDSTFGTNAVFSDFLPGQAATAFASTSQPDGKVIVTGGYTNAAGTVYDSLLVMRLKANGTPDSTFGTNGLVLPPGLAAHYGRRVKTDANGKIILATRSGDALRQIGVTRLNADGSNDLSFNGGNTVLIADPAFHLSAMALSIQSSGKIVVGARKGVVGGTIDTMVFYRINTDGTRDNNYGTNGVVTYATYFDLGNTYAAFDVLQDAADRLYAPTLTTNILPVPLQIIRFTADGQPDAAYGTNGYSEAITAQDGAGIFSIAQLDNGMVAGAFIANGALPVQIINTFRWDTTGHTDMTYGTSGIATTPYSGFNYTGINGHSIANGNHLLVVFDALAPQSGYRSVIMADINDHGVQDSTFGTNGIIEVDQTVAANATVWGVQKQADSSIIATTWMVNSRGTTVRFKPTGYNQAPAAIPAAHQLAAAVYPNPVTNVLTLKATAGVAYHLYDATGRSMLQGRTTGILTTLPVNALPAGTYALVCTDGTNSYVTTVVKQ